jgi:pimeloyl-ACP methyl ester carboxylesterase
VDRPHRRTVTDAVPQARPKAPWGAVLVHGAFRGGWAWQQVVDLLQRQGWRVESPTLTGCEPGSARVGSVVHLSEWIDDVVSAVESVRAGADRVLLVGHSQGGIVTTAARPRLGTRIDALLHLDAPVPADGQRGVDLNPPGVPAPPPGIDPALWIPARPVDQEQGFTDQGLAAFVNERLVPTPIGPSLEPIAVSGAPAVPERFVFCRRTPATYPCWSTRLLREDAHAPSVIIDSHHDAPLLAAAAVVDQIVGFAGSLGAGDASL